MATSFLGTITEEIETPDRTITKKQAITAEARDPRSITVPAGSVDQQVNIAIDVSAITALVISSDQDVTIETNAAASAGADDTLVLTADKPIFYYSGGQRANPFTSGVDVTAFFITNAGASDATVDIELYQDATPG